MDLLAYRVGTLKFKAKNPDLLLALIAAVLLPLACSALLELTGALVPLILYYAVFLLRSGLLAQGIAGV
jgi:hypothetical protein